MGRDRPHVRIYLPDLESSVFGDAEKLMIAHLEYKAFGAASVTTTYVELSRALGWPDPKKTRRVLRSLSQPQAGRATLLKVKSRVGGAGGGACHISFLRESTPVLPGLDEPADLEGAKCPSDRRGKTPLRSKGQNAPSIGQNALPPKGQNTPSNGQNALPVPISLYSKTTLQQESDSNTSSARVCFDPRNATSQVLAERESTFSADHPSSTENTDSDSSVSARVRDLACQYLRKTHWQMIGQRTRAKIEGYCDISGPTAVAEAFRRHMNDGERALADVGATAGKIRIESNSQPFAHTKPTAPPVEELEEFR